MPPPRLDAPRLDAATGVHLGCQQFYFRPQTRVLTQEVAKFLSSDYKTADVTIGHELEGKGHMCAPRRVPKHTQLSYVVPGLQLLHCGALHHQIHGPAM